MSAKSFKLYNVLVDLNVERVVPAEAVEFIFAKEEAFQVLATKVDFHRLTKWIASTFIAVALGQIVVLTGIIALVLGGSPRSNC